jgi:hypothetical protein
VDYTKRTGDKPDRNDFRTNSSSGSSHRPTRSDLASSRSAFRPSSTSKSESSGIRRNGDRKPRHSRIGNSRAYSGRTSSCSRSPSSRLDNFSRSGRGRNPSGNRTSRYCGRCEYSPYRSNRNVRYSCRYTAGERSVLHKRRTSNSTDSARHMPERSSRGMDQSSIPASRRSSAEALDTERSYSLPGRSTFRMDTLSPGSRLRSNRAPDRSSNPPDRSSLLALLR